jgi:enolase
LTEIINELPIEFEYDWINDLDMVVNKNYDMTFIDTYHIYGQLKRELEKYSKITNKYIIMHDTEIDGDYGELYRCGYKNENELYEKANIISKNINIPVNEILLGLNVAINEFLENNKDWVLDKKLDNNNGLTILSRL